MERLSLDDFKMKSNNSQELENLTGGILGACHCTWQYPDTSSWDMGKTLATYWHWATCDEHGPWDEGHLE